MWEAYGLENENFIWAATAMRGGMARYQKATCGAVVGGSIAVGLKYRCPLKDEAKAEELRNIATEEASQMVQSFIERYGSVICLELLGTDLSVPGAREKAKEAGLFEQKCCSFIQYVIERLYELDEKAE